MVKNAATAEDARISTAALRVAGSGGWKKLTLDAVAKAAKLPAAAIRQRFKSPVDLVPLIAAEIDRAAFAALATMPGTPHDMLFDLLMARFDVMQKHRPAILSMAEAARRDRALARTLACATVDGVYRIIDKANISAPPRPLLAAGIGAIYGWAYLAWRKDDNRDMGRTMAAVDRGLRYAEKAAGLIRVC